MTASTPPGPAELVNATMAQPGGGMSADPLATLRGLHFPEAVGVWPPAPGWWFALILSVVISVLAWRFLRARRVSVARHALAEVNRLDSENRDLQSLASALSEVLRRVALRRFGSERVASLHGESWQEFLAATSPAASRRRVGFNDEATRLLALAPYAPPGAAVNVFAADETNRAGVLAASRDWIRWNA